MTSEGSFLFRQLREKSHSEGKSPLFGTAFRDGRGSLKTPWASQCERHVSPGSARGSGPPSHGEGVFVGGHPAGRAAGSGAGSGDAPRSESGSGVGGWSRHLTSGPSSARLRGAPSCSQAEGRGEKRVRPPCPARVTDHHPPPAAAHLWGGARSRFGPR